ncbi:MAG TPA: DUF4350 domain-containing protein [Abditibacterium sp.]|jgi:hypothetical protein
MKKRRLDPTRLLVGFCIFAVFALSLLTQWGRQAETLPRAQFDDATPLGGRGLSLVLEKLGYSTQKQSAPLQTMPQGAKIWLILDPETRFSNKEAQILLSWVRRGGTLLFCVRPEFDFSMQDQTPSEGIETLRKAFGAERSEGVLPKAGEFLPELSRLSLDTISNYRAGVKTASGSSRSMEISRPHLEIAGAPGSLIARIDVEKGRVFVLPDALLLTNYALSKDDNATLVVNLLRAHSKSGAVYFDERSSGQDAKNAAPPTLITYLKKPPVSYAMWQLAVAGLLFWAFAARRLGAPVAIPNSAPVTRASQFAAAMGALFSKTNRPGAAATLIGARFRRRLAQRLGLSPAENDAVLAQRAQEVSGIPFEVVDRLLLQSRAPADNIAGALRDAQEMERVLKQLESKI